MRKYILITCIFSLVLLSMQNLQAQKKEFAILHRYKEANSLLPAPENKENRVVFMGNSITDSWTKSFFKNKPYINRGISGQTTPQMLIRFRQDVINLQPKVVVILAGTNDLAGNTGPSSLEMITDNIESMCELAIANNIKVVLCSVLPATIFPWRKEVPNPADKIIELNLRLKKYANKNGYTFVDYHKAMVNKEKGLQDIYAKDPVHPNSEGYKVMGTLVEKAISEVLNYEKQK